MLKLFIPLPKLSPEYGKLILDARYHKFHLFLNDSLCPDMKQVGYINRVYNNKIDKYVKFNYVVLKSEKKVFHEGYALTYDGIQPETKNFNTPFSFGFSWHGILTKYKDILKIASTKMSSIEKVILLNYSFYGDEDGHYVKSANLHIFVDLALRIDQGDKYLYYPIPKERSIEINYIPTENDKSYYICDDKVTVLPYETETYEKLCAAVSESMECVNKMKKFFQGFK